MCIYFDASQFLGCISSVSLFVLTLASLCWKEYFMFSYVWVILQTTPCSHHTHMLFKILLIFLYIYSPRETGFSFVKAPHPVIGF